MVVPGAPGVQASPAMRVVVGPVPVEAAEAWLSYAREVVDDLAFSATDECYAQPDLLATFDGYLRSWEAATGGDRFLWSADLPAEQVEYHMHAFQQVAGVLAERAERSGVRTAPEEGEPFYLALLNGVLAALESEGESHAEFAQHLGAFWPGREPVR